MLILSHPLRIIASMNESYADIDGMTRFLQTDGWSFGWDRTEKKGLLVWWVHAEKGGKRFAVCHKNLTKAICCIKYMVLSQN